MQFIAVYEKEGCYGQIEFTFDIDAPLSLTDIQRAAADFAQSLHQWPLSYVEPIYAE